MHCGLHKIDYSMLLTQTDTVVLMMPPIQIAREWCIMKLANVHFILKLTL